METVTDLVETWLETCRPEYAESTAQTYRGHVRQFCREHGVRWLADVDDEDLAGWCHDRSIRPSTRRSRWSALRGFFRWVTAQGLLPDDPTLLVPPPRVPRHVPRPLTPDEASAVLTAARRIDADCHSGAGRSNELIISLMVQEGLRSVEVRRLQVADVDLDRGQVHVHGKGDKDRVLPLSGQTRSVLVRHLDVVGRGFGPLVSKKGSFDPLTSSALNHRMIRVFEVSGVKSRAYDGKSAHSLRATAATDVYRGCLDVRAVQAMLGHSHLSSTQHYIELATAEHLRDAMAGRRY
jgi:integrase/recombinase XerC